MPKPANPTVRVALDAQPPLPLGHAAPPGHWYELEHLLLDAATGVVLCTSTDWDAWLVQALAHWAQGGNLEYASRLTGRYVPVTRR